MIYVQVEHGNNSGVWVKNSLKNKIRISLNGTSLIIQPADKKSRIVKSFETDIIIICPSLEKVTTSPFNMVIVNEDDKYNYGTMTIIGFNQQNLDLNLSRTASLDLFENKIGHLQALVGDNLSDNARFTINAGNQINEAAIKVAGKNKLSIESGNIINKRNFHISDSATVILSGGYFNSVIK